MFCKHCGKELGDNDRFCPNCGMKVTVNSDSYQDDRYNSNNNYNNSYYNNNDDRYNYNYNYQQNYQAPKPEENKAIKGYGLGFVLVFLLDFIGLIIVLFLGDAKCRRAAVITFIARLVFTIIFVILFVAVGFAFSY